MMYKLFFPAITVVIITVSCTNNSTDKIKSSPVDSVSIVPADTVSVSVNETTANYVWTTGIDEQTGKIQMKKNRPIAVDSVNITNMIGLTNNIYPEVKLVLKKISGDTIYVKIPESTYLTQQMGTSGAEAYMANATYNLTELPGIEYVNFDLDEGDHAAPGTFSRSDFE